MNARTVKARSYGAQVPEEGVNKMSDPNRNFSEKTILRSVRFPRPLDALIRARVRKTGTKWSAVVIAALERGLKGLK